ncbi:unnamed protein product, partial [Pylaiella littoralis]
YTVLDSYYVELWGCVWCMGVWRGPWLGYTAVCSLVKNKGLESTFFPPSASDEAFGTKHDYRRPVSRRGIGVGVVVEPWSGRWNDIFGFVAGTALREVGTA